MSSALSNLCPLCQQQALVLNPEGTLLVCQRCGARADFDGTTRRVRYTTLSAAYSGLDKVLRGRWLTRAEVFDVIAARPQTRRRFGIAVVLALLAVAGVVGLMALATVLVRTSPAQPGVQGRSTPMQAGSSATATGMPTRVLMQASVTPAPPSKPSPAPQQLAVTAPIAPSPTPSVVAVQPVPTESATPAGQAALAVIASPTPLPTVDGRRVAPEATQTPSPPAPMRAAPPEATPAAPNLPTSAPPSSQISATETPNPSAGSGPTITPVIVLPTETPTPTETPIPTPTQTPVPTVPSISNVAYVGGSTFEEYLELLNPTNSEMVAPIHTWKIRITTAVGSVQLNLGDYLNAPINMPAGQRCRIYTSKRGASADEASPCGFLTLGIVDDVDGIYPDRPGVTVVVVNAESRIVAAFNY